MRRHSLRFSPSRSDRSQNRFKYRQIMMLGPHTLIVFATEDGEENHTHTIHLWTFCRALDDPLVGDFVFPRKDLVFEPSHHFQVGKHASCLVSIY